MFDQMRKSYIFVSVLFVALFLGFFKLPYVKALENQQRIKLSYSIESEGNDVKILKGKKVIANILPPCILSNINQERKNISSYSCDIPIIENGYIQWKISKSEPSDVSIISEGNSKILKLDFHTIKASYELSSPFVKLKSSYQSLNLLFDYKIDTKVDIHSKEDEYLNISVNFYAENRSKILTQSEKIKVTPGWSTFKTSLSLPLDTKYINIEISQNNLKVNSAYFKDFKLSFYQVPQVLFKLSRVEKYNNYIEQEFENDYQKITRRIFISSSQDVINVEENLVSKVDHQVFKEYSPISFNSKPLYIEKRDYKLSKLTSPMYATDNLSDFYLRLEDAAIGYANNYDSIETYNLSSRADVYMFLSNADDVKYFVIGKNKEHIYTLNQLFKKGFERSYEYSIFEPGFPYAIKSRSPDGTKGILIFSNHSDSNMISIIKAMMFGTTDTNDKSYMKKGFIGYKIPITWGFFYKSTKGIPGFDNPEYKNIIENMKKSGIEVVLHTASPIAKENTPSLIEAALKDTSYLKLDDWIDHSLSDGTRCADLKSEGALKGSKNFSFDIFLRYAYKYCWSYQDVKLDTLNMLEPDKYNFHPQIFFKNYNFGTGDSLYQWNSVRYKNLLQMLTKQNLEKFIDENGVLIIHDYFSHPMQKNKFFYTKNKNVYITPKFDSALSLVRDYINKELLWVPTVKQFIDYEVAQKNIKITPFDKNTLIVDNQNNFEINGFTLIPVLNGKEHPPVIINLSKGINIVVLQ